MDAFWRFWDQMGAWQKLGLCFVAAILVLTIITWLV
jgi:hypothetical protein